MRRASRMVAALALAAASGCGIELEHGLDERQANEVVAALDRAGISADKTADEGPGAFKVVVPRAEAAQAFLVLEGRGLPRRSAKGVGEAFAEKGLLPSATAERARLSASMANDLERTLEGLPGVVSARVHLALPDDDPLHATSARPRPTASVLLRTRPGAPVGEADARKIVAGGVEGLQPTDVNVVVAAATEEAVAPELSQVGPLKVARGTRSTAVALGTAALAIIFALAIALVVGGVRLAALRRRLRERGDG